MGPEPRVRIACSADPLSWCAGLLFAVDDFLGLGDIVGPLNKRQSNPVDADVERGVEVAFEQVDLEEWDWPVAAYDAVVAIFIQFTDPVARARMFA